MTSIRTKKAGKTVAYGKISDAHGPARAAKQEPRSSSIVDLALKKATQQKGASLLTLVNEISRQSGYRKDGVIAGLMKAEKEKKIIIVEKKPFNSLITYAVSPYSAWFWGAATTAILSFLLIFVTSGIVLYFRFVFGIVLILFLPGYSLVELLYAKKKDLDILARVAFSIGLSLALVPLVLLVLNYTSFGIRLLPIAISLCGLIMFLLILAVRRKYTYYRLASYAY